MDSKMKVLFINDRCKLAGSAISWVTDKNNGLWVKKQVAGQKKWVAGGKKQVTGHFFQVGSHFVSITKEKS